MARGQLFEPPVGLGDDADKIVVATGLTRSTITKNDPRLNAPAFDDKRNVDDERLPRIFMITLRVAVATEEAQDLLPVQFNNQTSRADVDPCHDFSEATGLLGGMIACEVPRNHQGVVAYSSDQTRIGIIARRQIDNTLGIFEQVG